MNLAKMLKQFIYRYIYIHYILVEDGLIWNVIYWTLQKKLAVWVLRLGVILCISSSYLCNTSVDYRNTSPLATVLPVQIYRFEPQSHIS